MRSGDLKHRVTLTAPAGVLAEEAVSVEASVPAGIKVLPLAFQQREQLALGGLSTQTLYAVQVRYRTDIQPMYTLVEECCTQRTFQILAIIPSDQRDGIEMTCVTAG